MKIPNDTSENIKIVLVDDHAIIMDGIQALLAGIPGIEIVGKASGGNEALGILSRQKADIVITDYSMEDMDGLTLINNIKKAYADIKIIVLSMHDEPSVVRDVLSKGVDGYILKKYTYNELQIAIEVIREGGQFFSPEVNSILLMRLKPEQNSKLTNREREILKLLVNEHSNKQIADKLFISERTVETHRKNLLRKTNSSNIVGLLKYAHTHKIE